MRISLAVAALLASLAAGPPALATPGVSTPPGSASDTVPAREVHGRGPEIRTCTPAGCAGAPGGSSGRAALGFALSAIAAAWVSRRSPPAAD